MFELFADQLQMQENFNNVRREMRVIFDFINLNKGEQFNEEFKKISPFSKIPVLRHNNKTIFESGAILIYGNLSGEFYGSNQSLTTQWLMAQMGYIGPMLVSIINFIIIIPVKVIW